MDEPRTIPTRGATMTKQRTPRQAANGVDGGSSKQIRRSEAGTVMWRYVKEKNTLRYLNVKLKRIALALYNIAYKLWPINYVITHVMTTSTVY